MKLVRTLAIAAVTAVVSLGASPLAHADKPGGEPCAKQEQQVAKAQQALAHVTAVFDHQQTKAERLQEALAAATTPEEQARLQARLDKTLAHQQHTQKVKKAQLQRRAKVQSRLADCQAANAG